MGRAQKNIHAAPMMHNILSDEFVPCLLGYTISYNLLKHFVAKSFTFMAPPLTVAGRAGEAGGASRSRAVHGPPVLSGEETSGVWREEGEG